MFPHIDLGLGSGRGEAAVVIVVGLQEMNVSVSIVPKRDGTVSASVWLKVDDMRSHSSSRISSFQMGCSARAIRPRVKPNSLNGP